MTEPATAFSPAGIQRLVPPGFPSARYRVFSAKDIDRIPQLQGFPESLRTGMKAVAAVLPFRVNRYVMDELIDWSNVPADPIYQLTFPQPGMLTARHFRRMFDLVRSGASAAQMPHPVHATLHCSSAASPSRTDLHCTTRQPRLMFIWRFQSKRSSACLR